MGGRVEETETHKEVITDFYGTFTVCHVNDLNGLCMYIALFNLHKNSERKQML